MRSTYSRPDIVSSGHSPEPVEAGCCLASCGGSPGAMQSKHHSNDDGTKETLAILQRARSKSK